MSLMTVVPPVCVVSSFVVVSRVVLMSSVVAVSSMVAMSSMVTMVTTEVSASVQGVHELVEEIVVLIVRRVSVTAPSLTYQCRTPCCHSGNTQRQGNVSRCGAKDQSGRACDEKAAAGDPQPSHVVP
jgi:hypothetical protein